MALLAILGKPPGNGTLLLAMSPAFFRSDIGGFSEDVGKFVDRIRDSPPAVPGQPVLVPGDDQQQMIVARRASGINIDSATYAELAKLAVETGCDALNPPPKPAVARL